MNSGWWFNIAKGFELVASRPDTSGWHAVRISKPNSSMVLDLELDKIATLFYKIVMLAAMEVL